MNVQTWYVLEFPDGVEVFSESETGVLDLMSQTPHGAGKQGWEETSVPLSTGGLVEEPSGTQPSGTQTIREEIVVDAEYYAPIIYQTPELRPQDFRYTRIRRDPTVNPDPAIMDFFKRYPVLRGLVSQGDFVSAARILRHSRKLLPFVPLVRYLFRDNLFMIFALDVLHRFHGTDGIDLLSSGQDPFAIHTNGTAISREEIGLIRLAHYCRTAVTSRTPEAFDKESTENLLNYLDSHGGGLVLPVVGTFARPTARAISDQVQTLVQAAQHDTIIGGDSGAGARVETYLQSITVAIRHEPQNPHDKNALAVWVKMPPILPGIDVPAFRHAGYLKRQVAAILAPRLHEGLRLSARLARIIEGEMDVRIVADASTG